MSMSSVKLLIFYPAWVRDSKNEKVYHFHVESGKVEYVLMLPQESSEPQARESPRRPAQRKIWGVWITETRLDHGNPIFGSQNRVESPASRLQDGHVPPFAEI